MGKNSTIAKEQSRFSAHNLFHHDMTLSLDERMKYGEQATKILEEIKTKNYNLLENSPNYDIQDPTSPSKDENSMLKKKITLKNKLK